MTRTLHVGIRVADLDRSLAFYAALGYDVIGRVPETPLGELVMLKLAGSARSILTAERVALNFVQRLAGVATLTAQFVDAVKDDLEHANERNG